MLVKRCEVLRVVLFVGQRWGLGEADINVGMVKIPEQSSVWSSVEMSLHLVVGLGVEGGLNSLVTGPVELVTVSRLAGCAP